MFSLRRFVICMAATITMVFLQPIPWALIVFPRVDAYAAVLALWITGFCILWAGCWLSVVASFRGWS